MGKYEIEFSSKAAKNYKKLRNEYKSLIDMALIRLSEGLPLDVKPITGERKLYRIRVGKYRVLFTIIKEVIVVLRIGPRGDVYK